MLKKVVYLLLIFGCLWMFVLDSVKAQSYNQSKTRDVHWRLVHDGKKVLAYFETNGITCTIFTLIESKDEEICDKEIRDKKLIELEESEAGCRFDEDTGKFHKL